jgi:4-hydroxy-tetrahydrodipicolinate reductase
MLKLAVVGACGRMGLRLNAMGHESGLFELVGPVTFAGDAQLGKDIGELAGIGGIGTPVSSDLPITPDVLIDFSIPTATLKWLPYYVTHQIPAVIGTTGFSEDEIKLIGEAATKIPIVFAANMSLGVNLLFKLANQVAQTLDDAYDIEISEVHHRFKRDAPSGTAMELARQVAAGKSWPFPDCLQHGREGGDVLREEKTIGMHALRLGETVGIHDVHFSTLGETITLHHHAQSRDTFVRGALHAAKWLTNKEKGLYSMFDVLGL